MDFSFFIGRFSKKKSSNLFFTHGECPGIKKKTIIYAAMPQIKIDFKKEIEFVEFSPIFS